jgi:hypothetical protein
MYISPSLIDDYKNFFHEEAFVIDDEKLEELDVSSLGSQLTTQYLGKSVWLPITFYDLDPDLFNEGELLIPFATIKVSMKKEFVKTPLSQRAGTVRELYSLGDYDIQIKGFLIDLEGRKFPEEWLVTLNDLWSINEAIAIDNAATNIFLPEDEDTYKRVVITGLEIPETKNGNKHIVPFAMKLESDTIFTLEDE